MNERWINDCWAKGYCKQYQTEYCNDNCIGYQQLKFLYRTSGMPTKYHHLHSLDLSKKDEKVQEKLEEFRDNVVEKVEEGKGIVMVSPNKGNGKTSWSCIIMNEYFKNIALENNMKVRGKFISVPEFLQGLKDDFDRDDKQMEKTKKHIREADLVIWDDIGAETPTRWVKETLYTFINYRISNDKSQIYTSNKTVSQLENVLGERIFSRIKGQCLGVIFKGRDRRVNP